LCGKVRYTLTDQPMMVALCHCTHCQRTSGSAFSVNVMMRESDVTVRGPLAEYPDVGESGAPVRRCFCSTCGSSLLSVLAPDTGLIAVKAGTLDVKDGVAPSAEFWRRSAQGWLGAFPDLASFQTVHSAG
jgi:hypothetical protein